MDLSLVPLNDLLKEIESRSECFICAYELPQDKNKLMMFRFGHKGDWMKSVTLSSILNNDILNDWNGELQTLQRINNEQ